MKTQTYISKLEDSNGKMLDFWRWAYKKPETVMKKHLESCSGLWGDFWRRAYLKGECIAIYETPDGGCGTGRLVMKKNVSEIMRIGERE